MTHWQYLDEPDDAIQWMVRIDGILLRIERDRAKAQGGT